MDDLNEYRVFRAIADAGSLVRAAASLGIPRSTVSKRLADLEAKLGQALFKRTTRRIALTAAGRALYDSVVSALDILEDGANAVREASAGGARTIVISAPPLLARHVMGRVAGALLRRGRGLRIEVRSQRTYDPDRDADVDIRLSAHPDGRAPPGARIAGQSRRELFGAPSLVTGYAAPLRLADVTPDILIMRMPWEVLTMRKGRQTATLTCGGLLLTDHCETVRDAVAAGGLFGVLPRIVAMPYVERGLLMPVLPEWKLPEAPIAITLAKHARTCPLADEVARLIPVALHENGLFL